jgi:hypothetical protein
MESRDWLSLSEDIVDDVDGNGVKFDEFGVGREWQESLGDQMSLIILKEKWGCGRQSGFDGKGGSVFAVSCDSMVLKDA